MVEVESTLTINAQDGVVSISKEIAKHFTLITSYFEDDDIGGEFDAPAASVKDIEWIKDALKYPIPDIETPTLENRLGYSSWDDMNVVPELKEMIIGLEPQQLSDYSDAADYFIIPKLQKLLALALAIHVMTIPAKQFDMAMHIEQEILDAISPEMEEEILKDKRFLEPTVKSNISILPRPIPDNLTPPQKRAAEAKNLEEASADIGPHPYAQQFRHIFAKNGINRKSFDLMWDLINDFRIDISEQNDTPTNAPAAAGAGAD